jgi:hypothetical protein
MAEVNWPQPTDRPAGLTTTSTSGQSENPPPVSPANKLPGGKPKGTQKKSGDG